MKKYFRRILLMPMVIPLAGVGLFLLWLLNDKDRIHKQMVLVFILAAWHGLGDII